jgi:CheY-like chemotaxis protein
MTHDVLFFDDALKETENQLFEYQLRRLVREFSGEVIAERVVSRVETSLKARRFAAVVLDIMAAVPDEPNDEAMAGIEILKRCRQGTYGKLNRNTAVFMRTARGEPHIHRLATKSGCNAFYRAGSDDEDLLKEIRKILSA